MKGIKTRAEIIAAADRLFYERGFEHTSFADIAEAVALSRGNFYYHFRTKDEILDAVIERRIEERAALLSRWEHETNDPAERIRRFIRILIMNKVKILAHGCPVGTLCGELAKLDHDALDNANRLYALFRDWLTRQFVALGLKRQAAPLALHLLMRSQGVAALATALKDEAFVRREVADMERWLEGEIAKCTSSH